MKNLLARDSYFPIRSIDRGSRSKATKLSEPSDSKSVTLMPSFVAIPWCDAVLVHMGHCLL